MPISTSAAGAELPPSTQTVTVREILAYAAGIGDTSPAVFDDRDAGLVAPPQLCVRLEWPVVSHPAARQRLGAEADELVRGVHAAQDSHFHRPVRPGDELTTSGTIVAVRATRAGALLVTRLTTSDSAGNAVVTSWSTSIYRGVETVGEDAVLAEAPALDGPGGDDPVADIEPVGIEVARQMPHLYTECAAIWNPIHTERAVAERAGLPDIILHGTATWALAGREIIRRRCGGRPERLRRLYGRFTGMVIPGHPIRLDLGPEVGTASAGRVSFEVRNHEDQPALSDGLAEVVT